MSTDKESKRWHQQSKQVHRCSGELLADAYACLTWKTALYRSPSIWPVPVSTTRCRVTLLATCSPWPAERKRGIEGAYTGGHTYLPLLPLSQRPYAYLVDLWGVWRHVTHSVTVARQAWRGTDGGQEHKSFWKAAFKSRALAPSSAFFPFLPALLYPSVLF